jgi:ferredoxin
MKEFLVEQDRCNSCGVCLEVCREGAMVMEGGRAFILGEKCTACGACHKSCPEGAVVLLIKRVVKKQCREELKKLS